MKKNGFLIHCLFCGKEIYKRPSEILKKFCSMKCRSSYLFKTIKIGEKLKKRILKKCDMCDKNILRCPSTIKLNKSGLNFCSLQCKANAMKSGKAKYGFKFTGWVNNPYERKQIKKVRFKVHRKIMENHLGRPLLKSEVVHHINGDPKDNRLENLQIMTSSEHSRLHKKK